MNITCTICPHVCRLSPGQIGLCRARINTGEKIQCGNYGHITSIALDPVEKKPLRRFHPGSSILSVGSYGCNLSCPFCQNHSISMTGYDAVDFMVMMPEELAEKALTLIPRGNIGVAFTYNEPLIGYEYVKDCAQLIHEKGLYNVLVTNGYICEVPLIELLPFIDAMNIDLKGYSDSFYQKIRGDLSTVKRTIELASKSCHVEITTLIIPGENDSVKEIAEMSAWLGELNPEIPLHLSRFFPRYKYSAKEATDIGHLNKLVETAENYLRYVYRGNF